MAHICWQQCFTHDHEQFLLNTHHFPSFRFNLSFISPKIFLKLCRIFLMFSRTQIWPFCFCNGWFAPACKLPIFPFMNRSLRSRPWQSYAYLLKSVLELTTFSCFSHYLFFPMVFPQVLLSQPVHLLFKNLPNCSGFSTH